MVAIVHMNATGIIGKLLFVK